MSKKMFWLGVLFAALLPWRVLLPLIVGVAAVKASEEARR